MKKTLVSLARCAAVAASALPAHAAKGGLKTLGTGNAVAGGIPYGGVSSGVLQSTKRTRVNNVFRT